MGCRWSIVIDYYLNEMVYSNWLMLWMRVVLVCSNFSAWNNMEIGGFFFFHSWFDMPVMLQTWTSPSFYLMHSGIWNAPIPMHYVHNIITLHKPRCTTTQIVTLEKIICLKTPKGLAVAWIIIYWANLRTLHIFYGSSYETKSDMGGSHLIGFKIQPLISITIYNWPFLIKHWPFISPTPALTHILFEVTNLVGLLCTHNPDCIVVNCTLWKFIYHLGGYW